MFYRYEHHMSISHIALIVNMVHHIISLNPPTRSLSITCHWNVSLPSGVSPWNSIFGPGRRSKHYIMPNPVDRFILNIYDLESYFVGKIFIS